MKLTKKFECKTFKKTFYKKLISLLFTNLGISWAIIEPLSFLISEIENSFIAKIIIFLVSLFLSIVIAIYISIHICSKIFFLYEKIIGTDISIGLAVGNMLELKGDFVISTNINFTADESDVNSLQSQFNSKYYNDQNSLKYEYNRALDENELTKSIGSIIKVSGSKNGVRQNAYLLAIDNFDHKGVAVSSLDTIRISLKSLWKYMKNKGNIGHVLIPVIGSRSKNISVSREIIITEIIRSFISAIESEKQFCDKLTIVIYEDDYIEKEIDIQELAKYLHIYATRARWKDSLGIEPGGTEIISEHIES